VAVVDLSAEMSDRAFGLSTEYFRKQTGMEESQKTLPPAQCRAVVV
jgi:hypothetical protein